MPRVVQVVTAERPRNSNTLSDETDQTVAVLANTVYLFSFGLYYYADSVTPDIKIAFTCPASPTLLRWGAIGATILVADPAVTTVNAGYADGSGTAQAFGATVTVNYLEGRGILQNGANAGSLTMQIAQNSTDAVNLTRIKQGSNLVVLPVA